MSNTTANILTNHDEWDHLTGPRAFSITFTGMPKVSSAEPVEPGFSMSAPPACTCGPDEGCSECADEAAPADTSNVAVLIAFAIEVSPSGAGYIAQPEQWSQFGVGDTPYEALSDFFAVMAEHMDFLQHHEMSLTRGLANELGYLRTLAGNGRI